MLVCPIPTALFPVGGEGELHSEDSGGDDTAASPPQSASPANALKAFEEFGNVVKEKQLVVFLDYDGTLTPIVDVPSEAKISEEVRGTVHRVASAFPTAVITGRSISTVTDFMRLDSVYYAGSHGFDIRSPGGEKIICQVGAEFLPLLSSAFNRLRVVLNDIPGMLVEDNKYSVSVHYRRVSERYWSTVEAVVDEEIARSNGKLRKGSGKKVWELRANIDWHKGKAVRELLTKVTGEIAVSQSQSSPSSDAKATRKRKTIDTTTGAAVAEKEAAGTATTPQHGESKTAVSRNNNEIEARKLDLFAVYIGDDTTDEDAFRELSDSKAGVGIRVLSKDGSRGEATAASYVLESVEEVRKFLEKLLTLTVSQTNERGAPGDEFGLQQVRSMSASSLRESDDTAVGTPS
eukprot:CAMPEP_0197523478 /NCGR_PEP_ID=MMETSP1318-20131121/8395_1 /TAXON_ID=552666 /ORGANISM="Partenskyella glossopodia, Strain RCC365" /LENGTH=404 /DNA_ID=CAMNT_0043076181 /DNA_START=327 /DNA_END=1541 /DNA_ORIENTATION=-